MESCRNVELMLIQRQALQTRLEPPLPPSHHVMEAFHHHLSLTNSQDFGWWWNLHFYLQCPIQLSRFPPKQRSLTLLFRVWTLLNCIKLNSAIRFISGGWCKVRLRLIFALSCPVQYCGGKSFCPCSLENGSHARNWWCVKRLEYWSNYWKGGRSISTDYKTSSSVDMVKLCGRTWRFIEQLWKESPVLT